MQLRTLKRHLASTGCLFIVLGGSAYAATAVGPPTAAGDAKKAESRHPVARLVLPGVTGDGPDGAIAVRGIDWSNKLSGGGGAGGGAGPKPEWGDVVVAKAPDRSSPQLWKLAATGKHLPSAELELLAPGEDVPYATYSLEDVTASRFATRESGDEVALRFDPAAQPNPTFAFDPAAPRPALGVPRVGTMAVEGIAGESALVRNAWSVDRADPDLFGPFVVHKPVDGASSGLLARFASGQHIPKVTVKLLQPGSDTVHTTYVLRDVVVSSFGVAGDDRPTERVGLDAARVESTVPVPGGEPVRSCFDRKLNAEC